MEIKVITLSEKDYPPLLRETSNPPQKLFVRGKLPAAEKVCIAIVGTRKATSEGRLLAKKIGKLCAEKSYVVVSGLAMGIDTAAHEGALEGGGETIAVLGCGVDTIYPAQNENLAKKILSGRGAIISEYPNGTPALQHRFLERNRIVAGLAIATIVIEAPAKSGALVTARLAAEYGREVFVFPGSAGHPQYRGSHALIRDGARLVNSFEDVLEDLSSTLTNVDLNVNTRSAHSTPPFDLESESRQERIAFVSKKSVPEPERAGSPTSRRRSEGESQVGEFLAGRNETPSFRETKAILEAISKSKTPLSVDNIVELTNLTPQAVNRELSELLISRIIEEDQFGYRIVTSH